MGRGRKPIDREEGSSDQQNGKSALFPNSPEKGTGHATILFSEARGEVETRKEQPGGLFMETGGATLFGDSTTTKRRGKEGKALCAGRLFSP